MTPRPTEETIRQALTVPVPIEWAFATFTDLGRWWPHEYTWAAETLEAIGIEPREGRVRFHPADTSGTRVEVEHRGFARHGEGGEGYRQALASPAGWPLMLDRYAAALP
jgi:hypothetical protein